MAKLWRFLPHDADRVRQLEREARIPPVVAQLLVARGVFHVEEARQFLQARLSDLRDPEELPGIPAAAERIHQAVLAGRKIFVYGDYDADGMTGAAILLLCLRMLKADVGYYVPNRLEEGYGLNNAALDRLRQKGASLIVSVDCGIASVAEADHAKEIGLELIVTDHHEMAARLPNAAAIVHPRLPGTNYPFGGLCGAGVAFKLAWALCQKGCQAKKVTEELRNFLLTAVGLAAIGTVADVVPLLDENRLLVHHGLKSLRECPTPGLAALMNITQLDQKSRLTSEDIAFTLAPRLNAAGRLGQAALGVELLTTDSPERAHKLAEYIHELNKSRDSLERKVYLAANKQIEEERDLENEAALVVHGRGWHAGVIGIVASRLAEKYYRPVVVLSLDEMGARPATGSGRSAGSFHLLSALSACREHLLGFGGHAAAAGVQVEERNIDAFRIRFSELAADEIDDAEQLETIRIDAETPLAQLTPKSVYQIEMLAPFGSDNPRPILCACGVELAAPPKRMGGGERHLSLRLKQQNTVRRGVAFGQGDWAEPLTEIAGPIDIAYRPVINEYRGNHSVELHLEDWRPSAT